MFHNQVRTIAVAAIGLAASLSTAAYAADPKTEPGAASTQEARADQKYCVKDTLTGSRVERKICKTRAQWIREDNFDPTK